MTESFFCEKQNSGKIKMASDQINFTHQSYYFDFFLAAMIGSNGPNLC